MLKFQVTQETVSEYFRQVGISFNETAHEVMEEMGDILVGNITDFAPDWTSNLYLSGFEKDWWIIEPTETGTLLDIIYTGMLYEDTVGDDMKGWFEFGGSSYPPTPPARDYAYYQETGRDARAASSGARHKYFVAKGAKKSQKPIVNKAQEYLEDILKSAQR